MKRLDVAARNLNASLKSATSSLFRTRRGGTSEASWIELGDRARDARNWDVAAENYDKALQANPRLAGIWVQFGHALKESGKLDRAESAYRQALLQEPRNADTHLQLGHLKKIQGQPGAAIEFYARALELDGGLSDAAIELRHLGEHELARKRPQVSERRVKTLWIGRESTVASREVARLQQLGCDPETVWVDRTKPAAYPNSVEALSAFDVIFVVEDVPLFCELLRAAKGPIVFRSYGTRERLSDLIWHCGARRLVEERENVGFALVSQAALQSEDPWVSRRAAVIPYAVDRDLGAHANEWALIANRLPEIIIPSPSGSDAYATRYSKFLTEFFSDRSYRIVPSDLRPTSSFISVGGKVDRDRLKEFQRCAGMFYPYTDAAVLYMPCLEMIVLGAPVLYFASSSLAQIIGRGAPGEMATIEDVRIAARRLVDGDFAFARAIRKSQDAFRTELIRRLTMKPFDHAMAEMLAGTGKVGTVKPPQDFTTEEERQAERLRCDVIALWQGGSESQRSGEALVQTLFNVFLERDPRVAEIAAFKGLQNGSPGERLSSIFRTFLSLQDVRARIADSRMARFLCDYASPPHGHQPRARSDQYLQQRT